MAYATHGKPLTYRVTNDQDLLDKLVYFRAVDTSTLKPLPGSQGTSNKILLNFVNFENTEQTIAVKVTMPEAAVYTGERFGAGDTYEEARSYISELNAAPELELKETLGPGEAVQIILSRSEDVKLQAPAWVKAIPAQQHTIDLYWAESEGVEHYDIWRSSGSSEIYELIAAGVKQMYYTDSKTQPETTYSYKVHPSGSTLASPSIQAMASNYIALSRKDWVISSSSGKPERAIDDTENSRWDTGTAQKEGQYIQVDMNKLTTINHIELQTQASPEDYPRQYELYVSMDGSSWGTPITRGLGTVQVTHIRFPPQLARFIKIVQTGKSGSYWSIHELYIYGK
ncbi:F5/8 type C domain protein [compost metagenome]